MRELSRLLIMLMVAIFAVQPVMACCLTGHETAAFAAESADPSCHGAAQLPQGTRQASAPVDCPGCVDCDSVMIEAQAPEDRASPIPTGSDDTGAIALEARFRGFAPRLLVLATGPPRGASLPLLSPVTLKQRLLI